MPPRRAGRRTSRPARPASRSARIPASPPEIPRSCCVLFLTAHVQIPDLVGAAHLRASGLGDVENTAGRVVVAIVAEEQVAPAGDVALREAGGEEGQMIGKWRSIIGDDRRDLVLREAAV